MTTYGAINGIWTAGNYDQNTVILREEWGFKGIVMTDWWSQMNDEGEDPDTKNLAAMVRSQNDLYMVTKDASDNNDNLSIALDSGKLSRADLIKCAKNICYFLMKSPTMERTNGYDTPVKIINKPKNQNLTADFEMNYFEIAEKTSINLENYNTSQGNRPLMAIHLKTDGLYRISLTGCVNESHLAQVTVSMKSKGDPLAVFPFQGSNGETVTLTQECEFFGLTHYLSVYYSENGLILSKITFEKIRDIEFRA